MVLESLVSPTKAERRPWEMFFIGLVYASVAIFISLWVFQQYASLVMVFFTVMASIQVVHGAIKLEERKDLSIQDERLLIKEHGRALSFFMFLFLGFVIAFSLWYLFLPQGTIESLYSIQTNTIQELNSRVTGHAVESSILGKIFFNNLKVLLIAIFFSFFYGAGAIFILAWNASVIATAIGNFVRNNLLGSNYFVVYHLALLRYLVHGIPEILAYFVGGLAGGIISVAVIRHDMGSREFRHILIDSLDLIFLAIFLLIVAALLEVFVTPLFFS